MPKAKARTVKRGKCKQCSKKVRTKRDGLCGALCAGIYDRKKTVKKPRKYGKCLYCDGKMPRKHNGYCSPKCAGLGKLEVKRLYQLLRIDKGMNCVYCNREMSFNKRGPRELRATKDHIVPKSKGGECILSNLALCCVRCNQLKSDRPLKEFLNDKELKSYIYKGGES